MQVFERELYKLYSSSTQLSRTGDCFEVQCVKGATERACHVREVEARINARPLQIRGGNSRAELQGCCTCMW